MLEFLISCVLVLIVCYICIHFGYSYRYKHVVKIPGPVSLPILGTKWMYLFKGKQFSNDKLHEIYTKLFAEHGPVVREEAFWNIPIINICLKSDIEKVLRHCSKYPVRPSTEIICFYRKYRTDKYANFGLTNEQGDQWYRLRQILTPLITSLETVNSFAENLEIIIESYVLKIKETKHPETNRITRFDELMNMMCLESICTFILGRKMNLLSQFNNSTISDNEFKESDIAKKLVTSMQLYFCSLRDSYYGLPIWKYFSTKTYRNFVKSEEMIYEIISDLIKSALNEDINKPSILTSILKEPKLDVREKKTAIIDFISGGIQTISNTLIFALYLLAKNPKAQEKLYLEIKDDNSLQNCAYLKACILESFRLLPTANCLSRILQSDLELSGYQIKSNTIILCHMGIACRNNNNFPDATTFRPERWLNDEAYQTTRDATYLVTPFGFGRRMCPGKRFVEKELQIFLAIFLREFYIEYDGELELKFEFILSPKSPLHFIIKTRQ